MTMLRWVIRLGLLAALGVAVCKTLPDVKRYLSIRAM